MEVSTRARNQSIRTSSSYGSRGLRNVTARANHIRMWDDFKSEKEGNTRGPEVPNLLPLSATGDECIAGNGVPPSNDFCIKCSGINAIGDDGFLVCLTCGTTNTNILDYSPEWRFFSSDDRHAADPSRCGNPIDPLLEQSSYAGKVLCGGSSTSEMKNMGRWIGWQAMPANEKALYEEFQIITILSHNGGLPKIIIESAKSFYKEFYERQTCRGLNRDATRVGAVWLACWKHDCPRSANELAEIFKVDRATASAGCTCAEELLRDTERALDKINQSHFTTITASSFVERFCSKLVFPTELVALASFIARRVDQLNLITDNRPTAVAVGIILFVSIHCKLGHSKTAIKHALGSEVSEVTAHKVLVKLNMHVDKLIPASIIRKYTEGHAAPQVVLRTPLLPSNVNPKGESIVNAKHPPVRAPLELGASPSINRSKSAK
jgi:transcription initiation factor TFIIB